LFCAFSRAFLGERDDLLSPFHRERTHRHQIRESWRDSTLLRGGHPGPLSGLDGVGTRRRRVSVRLCFMSMAAVTSRFSFVLEGNCAFLFHHRREEPTLANTEPSAVRHDCAWPDPSRGAGRWGCQTKHPSRQVPVSTPVVYATSSRIGEGNTTFLDPVAEKPSTVVYRFVPAADTPIRCQTTIGMVAGGDYEQHPLWAACFCPNRFLAIISLSSSRDRRVPRR
jgi:hypothetical protein